MRARVLVRPKEGVLDPQGRAVHEALVKLGFPVAGARIGRLVELELELETSNSASAREEVERMCEQLLANPLIEAYEIELAK